jgi:hypothetical protein
VSLERPYSPGVEPPSPVPRADHSGLNIHVLSRNFPSTQRILQNQGNFRRARGQKLYTVQVWDVVGALDSAHRATIAKSTEARVSTASTGHQILELPTPRVSPRILVANYARVSPINSLLARNGSQTTLTTEPLRGGLPVLQVLDRSATRNSHAMHMYK